MSVRGNVWDRIFKGRMWSSWTKFKNHMKELEVEIDKEKNIDGFDYDKLMVYATYHIVLIKNRKVDNEMGFNVVEDVEEMKIGEVKTKRIDLNKKEIKKIIGY